jgi:hypothetical protein
MICISILLVVRVLGLGFRADLLPYICTCCCCCEFVSLSVQCLMKHTHVFCCDPAKTGTSAAILGEHSGHLVKSVSKYEETDSEENHPCKSGAQPPPPPSEVKFEIWCISQVFLMLPLQLTHSGFFFFVFNPYLWFLSLTRSSGLHPGDQQQVPIHRFCHPVLQEVSFRDLKKLFFISFVSSM